MERFESSICGFFFLVFGGGSDRVVVRSGGGGDGVVVMGWWMRVASKWDDLVIYVIHTVGRNHICPH